MNKIKTVIFSFVGLIIFHVPFSKASLINQDAEKISTSSQISIPIDLQSQLSLKFHPVGDGNCVTGRYENQNDNSVKTFLYDCGSASFNQETLVAEYIEDKQNHHPSNFMTPPCSPSSKTLPNSTFKSGKSPGMNNIDQSYKINDTKKQKINNIRKALQPDSTSLVDLNLGIISHGDTDHYNWFFEVINPEEDQVKTLILGGLPEHYDESEKFDFFHKLNLLIQNGTQVYFPALSLQPIKNLEAVLLPKDMKRAEWELHNNYAPPILSDSENPQFKSGTQELLFNGAHNLAPDLKIFFLSINPNHFVKGSKTRRMPCMSKNADSLVIKILHHKTSAILTGDANLAVTQDIIQNYSDKNDFLKTDILSASHHGSANEDANDECWLKATQPRSIIFSNGKKNHHPNQMIYDRYHQIFADKIRTMPQHEVWTWENKQLLRHLTCTPLFSTLTNGEIEIVSDPKPSITIKYNDQKIPLTYVNDNKSKSLDTVEDRQSKSEFVENDEREIQFFPETSIDFQDKYEFSPIATLENVQDDVLKKSSLPFYLSELETDHIEPSTPKKRSLFSLQNMSSLHSSEIKGNKAKKHACESKSINL